MLQLPATIPQAILNTVLGRLAVMFLAGASGDMPTARQAAHQMLAAYKPRNAAELTLAAEIVGFGLHALEALAQAADPDLSLNRIVRLRGSAVSLSREAHKSQRKLDQLQRASSGQQAAEADASPQPEPAPDPTETEAVGRAKAEGAATRIAAKLWLRSYHERETAERIARNFAPNDASGATHLNRAPFAACTDSAAA